MASDCKTPLLINNPFLEWMGLTLVEWSPGYAEMHLPMSSKLDNRSGRVHGGVICTLLDSVSGYSGLYVPPGEAPLARKSVVAGKCVYVRVSRGGRRVLKKTKIEKKN